MVIIFHSTAVLVTVAGGPTLSSCFIYAASQILVSVLYTHTHTHTHTDTRVFPKLPDWVDNEINNNKHSLRSNTKG